MVVIPTNHCDLERLQVWLKKRKDECIQYEKRTDPIIWTIELHGANSDNSFMKHFIQELRNQARGTPTDPPPSSSVRPPRK